jgi:hypothetical protein
MEVRMNKPTNQALIAALFAIALVSCPMQPTPDLPIVEKQGVEFGISHIEITSSKQAPMCTFEQARLSAAAYFDGPEPLEGLSFKFKSSDDSIVVVNETSGVVEAIAPGVANITVTTTDSSAGVEVTSEPFGITVKPDRKFGAGLDGTSCTGAPLSPQGTGSMRLLSKTSGYGIQVLGGDVFGTLAPPKKNPSPRLRTQDASNPLRIEALAVGNEQFRIEWRYTDTDFVQAFNIYQETDEGWMPYSSVTANARNFGTFYNLFTGVTYNLRIHPVINGVERAGQILDLNTTTLTQSVSSDVTNGSTDINGRVQVESKLSPTVQAAASGVNVDTTNYYVRIDLPEKNLQGTFIFSKLPGAESKGELPMHLEPGDERIVSAKPQGASLSSGVNPQNFGNNILEGLPGQIKKIASQFYAPKNFRVQRIDSDGKCLRAEWDSVPGATHYKVSVGKPDVDVNSFQTTQPNLTEWMTTQQNSIDLPCVFPPRPEIERASKYVVQVAARRETLVQKRDSDSATFEIQAVSDPGENANFGVTKIEGNKLRISFGSVSGGYIYELFRDKNGLQSLKKRVSHERFVADELLDQVSTSENSRYILKIISNSGKKRELSIEFTPKTATNIPDSPANLNKAPYFFTSYTFDDLNAWQIGAKDNPNQYKENSFVALLMNSRYKYEPTVCKNMIDCKRVQCANFIQNPNNSPGATPTWSSKIGKNLSGIRDESEKYRGAIIATFVNGKYNCDIGCHTAILDKIEGDSVYVWDTNWLKDGQFRHHSNISFKPKSKLIVMDANNYYLLRRP